MSHNKKRTFLTKFSLVILIYYIQDSDLFGENYTAEFQK